MTIESKVADVCNETSFFSSSHLDVALKRFPLMFAQSSFSALDPPFFEEAALVAADLSVYCGFASSSSKRQQSKVQTSMNGIAMARPTAVYYHGDGMNLYKL